MEEDIAFANYIVGQADADSTFCVIIAKSPSSILGYHIQPEWAISKKRDKELLEQIRDFLGVGYVYERQKGTYRDGRTFSTVELRVRGNHCTKVVDFFEKFPLRAEKRKDFELWKKAVRIYAKHSSGRPWLKEDLVRLIEIRKQIGELDRPKSQRRIRDKDIEKLLLG